LEALSLEAALAKRVWGSQPGEAPHLTPGTVVFCWSMTFIGLGVFAQLFVTTGPQFPRAWHESRVTTLTRSCIVITPTNKHGRPTTTSPLSAMAADPANLTVRKVQQDGEALNKEILDFTRKVHDKGASGGPVSLVCFSAPAPPCGPCLTARPPHPSPLSRCYTRLCSPCMRSHCNNCLVCPHSNRCGVVSSLSTAVRC
jgi:hypothetical protein